MRLASTVDDWRGLLEADDDPFAELQREVRSSRANRSATRTVKAEALAWYAMSGRLLHEAAAPVTEPPRRNRLAERFTEMRDRWRWSTFSVSSPSAMVQDPDFLGIIGMGRPGIPFVLRELADSGNPIWFYALPAMAHENPAADTTSASDAAEAWRAWGEARGLI